MSKSLAIKNGDLVVGASRALQVVSGLDKLKQDLKLWILERVGIDSMTPTFGSTLDGGIIDEEIIPPTIGNVVSADLINEVRAEVSELVNRYQQLQLEKIKNEVIQFGGQHTMEPQEVIDIIDLIDVRAVETTLIIRVELTTMNEEQLRLTIPVEGA